MDIAESVMNTMTGLVNNVDQQAAAEVVNQLRQKYPEETPDQLCERLIRAKCLKTGSVGAVTSGSALIPGVGSVAAMTFGVAADITLTFKHQAELVLEIASAYGHELSDSEKRNIILTVTGISKGGNQLLTKAGEGIAKKATEQLAKRSAEELITRSVTKAIPFVGVAVSGGVNMVSTYVIGRRSQIYFSRSPEELDDWSENMRVLVGIDERKLVSWMSETTTNSWEMVQSAAGATSNAVVVNSRATGKVILLGSTKAAESVQSAGNKLVSGVGSVASYAASGFGYFDKADEDDENDLQNRLKAIDQFAGIEPIESENDTIIAMIGVEGDEIASPDSDAGLMRRLLSAVPWPSSTETAADTHLFHAGEEITVIVSDDEDEETDETSGSIITRAFQVLGYRPAATGEEDTADSDGDESLTVTEIEPSQSYLGRVTSLFKWGRSDENRDPEAE